MLEQNIKKKSFLGSLSQSGKWNLAASKGQSVQLLPLHQSFSAASRSLSNFLREGISSWAGKHRQTDRPATGLGSQFSLLGVGSVLRMGKKLAYDWLPVPTGVKTETQCKVLKNKTTKMSDCEQHKNKENSLAQWNVFKHFKVKGCCRVFCHNHSCSNT